MLERNHRGCVFGPVPSRRLGLSLGVDLLVPKCCTLNCVYCELGPTSRHTTQRQRFRDPDDVLAQVRTRMAELGEPPDFITLAGWGEPCLSLDLGRIISELKTMGPQVAVLTNSTLLPDPAVRGELAEADVVIPSLDAVSREVFEAVNRPAPGLDPGEMIEGIIRLKEEFAGEIRLEILLVDGVNDSEEELAKLIAAAARVSPDLVQLGTVVRPPADSGVKAVSLALLEEVARRMPVPVELIPPPKGKPGRETRGLEDTVVEMTNRRPCTTADIAAMSGADQEVVAELVERLAARGRLAREEFGGLIYYRGHT